MEDEITHIMPPVVDITSELETDDSFETQVATNNKTEELLDEIQDLKVLIKALTKALTDSQKEEAENDN